MTTLNSQYDFSNFPRRPLTFGVTRRQLFLGFKLELDVAAGQQQGGRGLRLSALGSMPDDALAVVVPRMAPDCRISVAHGFVWGRPKGASAAVRLFPADETTIAVFNQMNGRSTLDQIARAVAHRHNWPVPAAFAYARGLFLHLVQLRVCLPAGGRSHA